MGRPSLCGDVLTNEKNMIIGFSLGHGGYHEHSFDSNEDVVKYVKMFNDVPDSMLLSFGKLTKEEFKAARKQGKKDFKLINKHVMEGKGTYFPMYSQFILRPSLNVYTRDFTINNSEFKGNPALLDGEYTLLAIEGIAYQNVVKDMVNRSVSTRHTVCESELMYSPDYCNSLFTCRRNTMASYSNHTGFIILLINKDKYAGISELVVSKLRAGYLGLMYGTKISPFLSLLFLDRLVYGEDKQ